MKKYIFIAASALIFASVAKAQDRGPSDFITIGGDVGTADPSRSYGASFNGVTSSINGSANNGFHYDIYGGVNIFGFLGVMAQYGADKNSYNSSDLNNFAPPGSANGGYQLSEYLIGPYFTINGGALRFEAKLLFGELSANYPALSFGSAYDNVEYAFQSGNGFGYCAGVKLKYMIGGLVGAGVGLNYVASDVKYSGWSESTAQQGQPSNGAINMKLGLWQATAGLSVDF